jgi:hypothetical protein
VYIYTNKPSKILFALTKLLMTDEVTRIDGTIFKKITYYLLFFKNRSEQLYDKDGCVLVSSSGLVVGVVVQEDQQAAAVSAATARVGRGGRTSRLLHADMAACATTGQFLLALCGDDTPITVYTVTNALDSQGNQGARV